MDELTRYLESLRVALRALGADPAVAQDAEFDAAEHLGAAGEEGASFADAVAEFGEPNEVAEAYLQLERGVADALRGPEREPRHGLFTNPGISTAARLAYLLLSLGTGIAYFTVAVLGLALSATLAVFIVGIPFILVFIGVVRTLSLVEGRIIETLLDVRMPRRPLLDPAGGWLERIRHWFGDRRTWTSLVYMLGQLPLGIAYFAGTVAGFGFSLWFLVGPWLQTFAGVAFLPDVNGAEFFLDGWAVIPASAAGLLMLFVMFAVVRLVGRIHARYAKWMLVGSLGGRTGAQLL